jgi:hypothetical protein
VSVLYVNTTSVLCMKLCVCDSVLEKVEENLWLKHRVGLLGMATLLLLLQSALQPWLGFGVLNCL